MTKPVPVPLPVSTDGAADAPRPFVTLPLGPAIYGGLALVLALSIIAFVVVRRKDTAVERAAAIQWRLPQGQPPGFAEAIIAASRPPTPEPAVGPLVSIDGWTPLLEQHLSAAARAAPLEPEALDAILRIEGIYDPTRIGYFGRALRMEVRAGTMSMGNVFADRWIVASSDPNIHYRVRYLAQTWLWPGPRECPDFRRVRPHDSLSMLDQLSDSDCQQLHASRGREENPPVVAARLSLPVFAAPYPGSRLTHEELVRAQAEHALAVRERMRILWSRDSERPRPRATPMASKPMASKALSPPPSEAKSGPSGASGSGPRSGARH